MQAHHALQDLAGSAAVQSLGFAAVPVDSWGAVVLLPIQHSTLKRLLY